MKIKAILAPLYTKQVSVNKIIRVGASPTATTYIKFHSTQLVDNGNIHNTTLMETLIIDGDFWYYVDKNSNGDDFGVRVEWGSNVNALDAAQWRGWKTPSELVGVSEYTIVNNTSKMKIVRDYGWEE